MLYGPAPGLANELPLLQYSPPLFLGLDLGTLRILPFPLLADGAGEILLGLFNASGAVGVVAIQMLLIDEFGQALATSTTAVF